MFIMEAGYMEHPLGYQFQRSPGLPYWTIAMLVRGQSQSTFGRQTTMGKPGWFVAIMPNTPYRFVARTVIQEIWCLATLRPAFERFIRAWESSVPGRFHVWIGSSPRRLEIMQLMQSLSALLNASDPAGRLLAANTLERVLLLANEAHLHKARPPLDERVIRVQELIEAQFAQPLTPKIMADQAHVSLSRLTHLFRAQAGQTLMAFLKRRRMKEAVRLLLATNLRIGEIASTVGYVNPYHFCVRFKKHTGLAPRDYRRAPPMNLT
jgi:AraC family transcriptional regulator of arabinose operon